MIFAWVEERRTEFPVAVMCRVRGVSGSGYYARATRSPSAAATRRDNAVIASAFGRMNVELVHQESYATRDEAKASIFEYIEVFYDRVRRHSTPEYLTPDEFERTHNPSIR